MLAAAIQRFTERSPTPNTSGACVWLMPPSTALTTRWRNCACALAFIFFIGVSSIYPLTHHAIFCCRSNMSRLGHNNAVALAVKITGGSRNVLYAKALAIKGEQ